MLAGLVLGLWWILETRTYQGGLLLVIIMLDGILEVIIEPVNDTEYLCFSSSLFEATEPVAKKSAEKQWMRSTRLISICKSYGECCCSDKLYASG